MKIAPAVLSAFIVDPFVWGADWVWGVPLIVLTVVIHIIGLGLVSQRALHVSSMAERSPMAALVLITGAATLLATCLHAIEAGIWAATYLILGIFPNFKSSMLYSLNALTSYGHTELSLKGEWRLMGALEALNGWLLFGITTAFLFAVIQTVWSSGSKGGHKKSSETGGDPVPTPQSLNPSL